MASDEAANFVWDRGRMVYAQLQQARALNAEMLAALKAMLPENNDDPINLGRPTFEICEQARDAIAKAEGPIMSFTRKSELLAAEATAILIDGVAAVLFFACAFVWLAIYATAGAP